jgi:hypothetical protein
MTCDGKTLHQQQRNSCAASEAILHEIVTMKDALRESTTIVDVDRRRIRWEITELRRRAEFLMNWLSEARLEHPKH